MKVTIPATILQRFTLLPFLKIEISQQRIYLIGTNDTVGCVQYIGDTKETEDSCYINIVDSFKEVVDNEAKIEGSLTFETLPELAMGSIIDTLGRVYTDFISWPDESTLDNWYNWFELSTEQKGFLYCDLLDIQTLWQVSPTGELVFPEVINSDKPIIVRDVNNDNWVGVFIPNIEGKRVIKPATLPEWL
jgi:hypothetical protein